LEHDWLWIPIKTQRARRRIETVISFAIA
jgi:hypothetical protein